MTISERYRQLSDATNALTEMSAPRIAEAEKMQRKLCEAADLLKAMDERVGEIPQFKLEDELSPVLLKVHNRLDQARLMLEAEDEGAWAEKIWNLEQTIYRLLNSL